MKNEKEIAKSNLEMLKSYSKEFIHHGMELQKVLKKETEIDAWVVAKAERATTDLSDITHYLDGKSEYAKGGIIGVPLNMINEFKRNGLLVVSNEGEKGVILRQSPKNSYNESDYTKSYIVKTEDGEKEIMARYLRVVENKMAKGGWIVTEKNDKYYNQEGTPLYEIQKDKSGDEYVTLDFGKGKGISTYSLKHLRESYAKGGTMNNTNNGEANAAYLDSLSETKKSEILNNIAKHNNISIDEAKAEVVDSEAELLYEYIANNISLARRVYFDMKENSMAKGGITEQYSVVLEAGDIKSTTFKNYLKRNGIKHKILSSQYGNAEVEFVGSKEALIKMIDKFWSDMEKEDYEKMYSSIKKYAKGGEMNQELYDVFVRDDYNSKWRKYNNNELTSKQADELYSKLKQLPKYSDIAKEVANSDFAERFNDDDGDDEYYAKGGKTSKNWSWRFKTEDEFEKEFGDNWRRDTMWSFNDEMDYLLGKKIEKNTESENYIKEFILTEDEEGDEDGVSTGRVFGIPSNEEDNWRINYQMLTQKPLKDGMEYAKGGKLSNRATYIPKRHIAEIEVEKNGKTTFVDGANLFDGVYVKKSKFEEGGLIVDSVKVRLEEDYDYTEEYSQDTIDHFHYDINVMYESGKSIDEITDEIVKLDSLRDIDKEDYYKENGYEYEEDYDEEDEDEYYAKGGTTEQYAVVLEADDINSKTFKNYLKKNGITHEILSSQYGTAEVYFKGSKEALRKMIDKFWVDIEKEEMEELYNSIKKYGKGGSSDVFEITVKKEKPYPTNPNWKGVEVRVNKDGVPLTLVLDTLIAFKDQEFLQQSFEQRNVMLLVKKRGRYYPLGFIDKNMYDKYVAYKSGKMEKGGSVSTYKKANWRFW